MRVSTLDGAREPLRVQLRLVRTAAVGVTPDGGTSFVLAFLPRGGALVVLGALERWLWANDGRLRAFYCQPRQRSAREACPSSADHVASADCYAIEAVLPCVEVMLRRARVHVRHELPRLFEAG